MRRLLLSGLKRLAPGRVRSRAPGPLRARADRHPSGRRSATAPRGLRRADPGRSADTPRLPGKGPGRRRAGNARGLTLLEMLAVLVLVSLLGVLLIQGTGFFLGKYSTVKRIHRETSLAALRQHWFVSTLQAMLPSDLDARRFMGESASFEGVTLQSLAAEPGLPVRVRWSIDGAGASQVLYSEEGGAPWTVLASNDEALAFEYADSAGQWHDHWPLASERGHAPEERIPRMVRLISAADRIRWLAHLDLFPEPVPNYLDDD